MDRFLQFLLVLWGGIARVWRSPQLSSRRRHRPMISVRQLEERIVLNADFNMTGGALALDNFNSGSTSVTVSEGKFDVDGVAGTDDVYSFQLNTGTWDNVGANVPNTFSISGNTLHVLKSALNENLQITDNNILVTLQALGAGTSGAVNADLTVQAQSINLNGNLTTDGKNVSLNGATTMGQSVAITTTNSNSAGNSGNVTFGGSITTALATRSLTVNAGSAGTGAAGDVKFLGSIGSSLNLQGVFVTGKEVLFNDLVRVAAGGVNVNSTGSTTLNGNLTTANGTVRMQSGDAIVLNADLSAGNQTIQLAAQNDITLGQLTTTRAAADAVSIISQSGAIKDGNGGAMNIVAAGTSAGTTLQAAQGIGFGDALEVNLTSLNASNTGVGDIQLVETNAITVQTLQTADGNINLQAGGIITVDNGNSIAIQAGQMGQITLTALGTSSDIVVKSGVQSSGGDITVSADRDVLQNAFGGIASQGGDITATAGRFFTMGAGRSIDAGAGRIDIQATNNVTIESLRSEKTAGQAIRVASLNGAILDVTDAALNIDAQGTGAITTLSAATGIGAANGIEINSTLLNASNFTSGNVWLVEADSVTVVNLTQASPAGTILLTALNGAIGADSADAKIESQGGAITLTAAADVTLGQVKTANNSVNAIAITSQSGSIIGLAGGMNENVTTTGASARVTLNAAKGIIGEGGGDLRTALSQLSATNSTSGEIRIAEKDDLTITNLKQTGAGATGDVALHAGGNITVANTSPNAVQVQGTGAVLLKSTGAGILVQGKVNAGTGTITLDAQNNVEFTATGQANSGGTVNLSAGQEIKGTATGTHVIADQLTATAVTGITLLNTSVNTLSATNLTSGNIQIKETDNVTVTSLKQTNGSGNIALTTVNGSITVDAGSPAAVAVKTNGAGTILLDAVRVSPSSQDLTVLSSIASDAGAITLRGDQNLVLGSGVTVASQSGAVSATATRGSLEMQGTSIVDAGTGTVTLLGAGNVTLGHVITGNNTADAVRITSQSGAILDGGNNVLLNVQANALNAVTTFSAAAGIGALNAPLRVDLSRLSASNTGLTGDIRIDETDQLIVQSLVQTNASGNGSLSLKTLAGTLTINNGSATVVAVQTYGSGSIGLTAGGPASELSVQSKVTSAGGSLTLNADHDVLFGDNGDLASTTGNVSISAAGKIEMSNGTQINAGSGTVSLTAAGDVTLGELRTTNNTAAAISVISTSAGILDGNDNALNLVASSANARTTLHAETGIGTALDALEVDLARLDAVNSNSGELRLLESNAIIVENLQQSGTGNIELKTVNGSITVDSPSNGIAVHTQGSGAITLQAGGTSSDLLVLDQIEAAQNNVQLQAGRSLTFDQNGRVDTPQNVSLQAGTAINTTGSQLISAAGLTAVAATGIVLRTAVDTLSATNSTSGNIQITETDAVTVTALKQAAGNGNVSLVTQNGSITVDNGQVPPANTVAVEAKGTGNVQLQAQGLNSQLLLNSGVNAVNGTVTLAAEKEVSLGEQGDVTTTGSAAHVFVTSSNSDVVMDSDAEIRAGGSINVTAAHGDVTLGLLRSTLTNGNAVTITSGGAIYDGNGSGLNIDANGLGALTTLSAVSGIGASNPNIPPDVNASLEIDVTRLSASNTATGDIRLLESNSISIASLFQSAPTGEIELIANGLLAVENTLPGNPTIQNTGSGGITMQAQGVSSDLNVQGGISTNGGAINLAAARNAGFGTDGDLTSQEGNLSVTAGAGTLAMANGTAFHTENGSITLSAQGAVTLGELTSHKTDASNPVTAVSVTSVAGAILDGNGAALNIDANRENAVTVLRTALGIASAAGDPLETHVTFLDAVNSNNGSIQIQETDDVVVLNLKQLAGTGSISLATSNGNIAVADVNPVAVQAFSVGTVSLNAQGLNAQGDPASLTVQGKIQSEGGAITLQGKQDVTLEQNGGITSSSGTIGITAQEGTLKILDGRTVKTGSTITLKGTTGIELKGLVQTTANGSISATTTNGNILIDNGTHPAVQAGGVGTVLIDAQGANASLLVQSQVQSSLGAITLQGKQDVTLQGKQDVTLEQNGDVTSSSGTIGITAQEGTLKILDGRTVQTGGGGGIIIEGETGIELRGLLKTNGNGNITATAINGNILIDNDINAAIQAGGVGAVRVDAQGDHSSLLVCSQIQSDLRNIELSAQKNVVLAAEGNVTSNSGAVFITARDGAVEILDGRKVETSGSITVEGETGVELRGLLRTNGNGSVAVTAVNGDILIDNLLTPAIHVSGVGTAKVDAQGDGSNLTVDSRIESELRNIELSAQNNVTIKQNANITSNSGAVFITARDGAAEILDGRKVETSGSITVEGETGVELRGLLKTNGNGSVAVTAVNGDILIDNSGNPAIQVSGVGTVLVDAQGTQSSVSVQSRIESELRRITLQAEKNITFGANGDISSQAGAIFATAKTGELFMDAGTQIQSGTGRIALDAKKDVTLGEVKTGSANSVVTIPAVMITSHEGAIRDGIPDGIGAAANITTTHVSSTVVLSAATGIGADDALETNIVRLNAEVTGAGAIQINEFDNLIITDVRNANGFTSITAGGNMTVQSVISQTDSDANDITLVSTGGGIAVQSIQAGPLRSDVILQSAASITSIGSGTHVTADNLQATAGSGISLNTSLNSLNALVTGAGSVQIQETDTINLASVRTADGAITVTAGGTITATSVISQTDSDANDISLTSTGGGINVQEINAGMIDGDVVLRAQGGAIQRIGSPTLINVIADDLNVVSVTGVNLYTEINDLVGSVTGVGDFLIEEASSIRLASSDSGSDDDRIQTIDGRIQIRAAGNITIVDTDPGNDGPDRRQDEEIIAGGSASSSASSAGRILLQAGNIGGHTGDIIFQPYAQISAVQAAEDRGAIVLIANGNFDFDSSTSQITTYNGAAGGTLRTPTPTIDNLTGGNPDLVAAGSDYRGTFEVQLGASTQGEQGLELHIDWGDQGTKRYEGPDYNNQGPLNPSLEGLSGEQQLTLRHDYTIEDVQFAQGNGRQNGTDPLQVRFAVSHDPSIVIFANTLNTSATTKTDGDLSLLTSTNNLQGAQDQIPLNPVALLGGVLSPIQSGAGVNQTGLTAAVNTLITPQFAETLESGVQTFRVPPVTPPRDMLLVRDPGYPVSEPLAPAVAPAPIVTAAVQVVPTIPVASSTTFFRDEYFQIKALSPDPNAETPLAPPERLPDDILSGDRLGQLFSQLPDGQYQIDYVLGEGNERSILKFDIRQGQPVVPGGEVLDGGQLKLDDITEQLKRAADPAAIDPSTTSNPQSATQDEQAVVTTDVEEVTAAPGESLTASQQISEFIPGVDPAGGTDNRSQTEPGNSEAEEEVAADSNPLTSDEEGGSVSAGVGRGAAVSVIMGTTSLLRRIRRRQFEPSRFSATGRLMQRLKQAAEN